jgi:uncharacterized protein
MQKHLGAALALLVVSGSMSGSGCASGPAVRTSRDLPIDRVVLYRNGVAYFASTSGGEVSHGQIWEYKPAGRSSGFLKLVYETPDPEILTFPDNLVVTPRGGLVLCEDTGYVRSEENFLDDGSGQAPFSEQKLKGLTRDGRIFDFAVNILDDREWAGACWSPDGKYLFVNTQGDTREPGTVPGRTYAIWGPWEQGAL